MRKPTLWVPTRSDTDRAIQSQKMVRGWKFWIWKWANGQKIYDSEKKGPQGHSRSGASLGKGNESLYKWSGSHDKDGHHGYK